MKIFAYAALVSAAAAFNADMLGYIDYTARFSKLYYEVSEFLSRFENFKNNT